MTYKLTSASNVIFKVSSIEPLNLSFSNTICWTLVASSIILKLEPEQDLFNIWTFILHFIIPPHTWKFAMMIKVMSLLLFWCFASKTVSLIIPHRYESIINFGNSISDTGNYLLMGAPAYPAVGKLPYGETFFKHPTGRFSDGRLIVDFIGIWLSISSINFSTEETISHTFLSFRLGPSGRWDYILCCLCFSPNYSYRLFEWSLHSA